MKMVTFRKSPDGEVLIERYVDELPTIPAKGEIVQIRHVEWEVNLVWHVIDSGNLIIWVTDLTPL
jgi:hypothetical protein